MQLGNRFDSACLQLFGPEFYEQGPRCVDIGTVDLAIDRECITNDVALVLNDSGESVDVSRGCFFDF